MIRKTNKVHLSVRESNWRTQAATPKRRGYKSPQTALPKVGCAGPPSQGVPATACFLSAGTLDWPRAWIYLGLQLAIVTSSAVLILRANPALVTARGRIHRDVKRFGRVILRIYVLLLFAMVVVAGLDAMRYHWSAALPFATVYWGALLNLVTTVPVAWALMVNPLLNPPCASRWNANTCQSPRGPTGWCGIRCTPG